MHCSRALLLTALLTILLTTTPASAQPLGNTCQTGLHRLQNHDPAAAALTLVATLIDIFADGPPSPDLTIYITLPPAMVPDCPEGAWGPVYQIARLQNGLYTGRIQSTNISGNRHVFQAKVVFTADAVLEWQPWEAALTQPLPGGVIVPQDERPCSAKPSQRSCSPSAPSSRSTPTSKSSTTRLAK